MLTSLIKTFIPDGTSIQSSGNIGYVYRFENGKKRQYLSNEIADSWDANWKNAKIIPATEWAMIPVGEPMAKKTNSIKDIVAGVNPLTSSPLAPPTVTVPTTQATTPRTVNPNPTTPSVVREVETVAVEDKLLGVKKPMAYYIYGGGLLLLIVVAYFIFRK